MALPTNKEQIFQQIESEYEANGLDFKPSRVGNTWLKHRLAKASEIHGLLPTTKSLLLDYYQWQLVELAKPANGGPFKVSTKEFFSAVYDQFTDQQQGTYNDKLAHILARGLIEPICIGHLNGGDALYLSPSMSDAPVALRSSVPVPYKRNDDGHRYIRYRAQRPWKDCKGKLQQNDMIERQTSASEELKALFQFRGLGWVVRLKEEEKDWEYTGHALVIDLDEGRNFHPWLVLSSKVPTKDDPKIILPNEVLVNDISQTGVLPRDRNRTSVAKILPTSNEKGNRPALLQLGKDFSFKLAYGEDNTARQEAKSLYGPPLSQILVPYHDPVTGEDVCYAQDGKEILRCNRQLGRYRAFERSSLSGSSFNTPQSFLMTRHAPFPPPQPPASPGNPPHPKLP